MYEQNAILFCQVDRDDYWVSGGLVFRTNGETYEECYKELKQQLEYPDFIAYVIEEYCLLSDLFNHDETYKFKRTSWDSRLVFEFENSEGNIESLKLAAHRVYVSGDTDYVAHVSPEPPSDEIIEERVLEVLRNTVCNQEESESLSDEQLKDKFSNDYEICIMAVKEICKRTFDGTEWFLPSRSCPCTYLDEPCNSNCSCKSPVMSGGCYYCATYGSKAQRKEKAEWIASKLRQPDMPDLNGQEFYELMQQYRHSPKSEITQTALAYGNVKRFIIGETLDEKPKKSSEDAKIAEAIAHCKSCSVEDSKGLPALLIGDVATMIKILTAKEIDCEELRTLPHDH